MVTLIQVKIHHIKNLIKIKLNNKIVLTSPPNNLGNNHHNHHSSSHNHNNNNNTHLLRKTKRSIIKRINRKKFHIQQSKELQVTPIVLRINTLLHLFLN